MKKITQAETLILRMRSLRVKLYESVNQNQQQQQHEGKQSRDEEMEKFINDLLTMPEVLVKGGVNSRIGKSVKYLLRHQKVRFRLLILVEEKQSFTGIT